MSTNEDRMCLTCEYFDEPCESEHCRNCRYVQDDGEEDNWMPIGLDVPDEPQSQKYDVYWDVYPEDGSMFTVKDTVDTYEAAQQLRDALKEDPHCENIEIVGHGGDY